MNRAWWHVVLGGLSCSLLSPCFAAPDAPQSGTFDLFTAAEVNAWNALPCPHRHQGHRRAAAERSSPSAHEVV